MLECFVVRSCSALRSNTEHLIKEKKTKVVQSKSREILTSPGESHSSFQFSDFYKVRVQIKIVKRKQVKPARYKNWYSLAKSKKAMGKIINLTPATDSLQIPYILQEVCIGRVILTNYCQLTRQNIYSLICCSLNKSNQKAVMPLFALI